MNIENKLKQLEAACIVELMHMFPSVDSQTLREAMIVAQRNTYRELNSVAMEELHDVGVRLKRTEERLWQLQDERRTVQREFITQRAVEMEEKEIRLANEWEADV